LKKPKNLLKRQLRPKKERQNTRKNKLKLLKNWPKKKILKKRKN